MEATTSFSYYSSTDDHYNGVATSVDSHLAWFQEMWDVYLIYFIKCEN